ncbi:MAG: YbhB/YbcL family Raf kinase inhibitor-like protein, partial [Thiohalospira sp.]
EDRSPALKWSGAPAGTAGFAVICHDPDAPLVSPGGTYGFVHWALYNLPAEVTSLEEATAIGTAGINDVGNIGYNGPMPPAGHGVHRYYFWVIALDAVTDLPEGLTLWQLLERIEPNILGMNRLVGTYQR